MALKLVKGKRKPTSAKSVLSTQPPDIGALIKLWLLRMLVPLGGHRGFVYESGFRNDDLAAALGLGDWEGQGRADLNIVQARTLLRDAYLEAERKNRLAPLPSILASNLERLAALVGLSAPDIQVLAFVVLLHVERLLDDTADYLGSLSSAKAIQAMSVILGVPEPDLRTTLSGKGLLARTGLVWLNNENTTVLRNKVELLSGGFADRMIGEVQDPVLLIRDVVSPTGVAELTLADYGHAQEPLTVIRHHLESALESARPGVNVLVYGSPGTGKSQLARALAREIKCEMFEVASEDADGDPVNGERRLRAFRAAQAFFSKGRTLLLFDETEDVFNDSDGPGRGRSTAQKRKAWMNRMLEQNPVPTIWLSNFVECLDPAFVRRFDVVMELPVPPKKERLRIVSAACGDLVSPASLDRLASATSLAPAVITRAAGVVRSISARLPATGVAQAVETLVEGTLVAQGHHHLLRGQGDSLPEHYDPRFINADADLPLIAEGLIESKTGRLCLFGPPGTGKTAFGRWLADRIGAPLDARRVSDIVSPFIGMTEKNLARAFREAQRSGAVLMLDEVDSFLQDRRGAHRSWEVTEVNEMLTQMEAFGGLFIATTNLLDNLDQAALRRFDIKLRFGYLKPEQAVELFRCECRALQLVEPSEGDCRSVSRLGLLTPGEFAAARRQHRFRRFASPPCLVAALEQECALKEGGASKAIGFR